MGSGEQSREIWACRRSKAAVVMEEFKVEREGGELNLDVGGGCG
jgi:hypothetical protein